MFHSDFGPLINGREAFTPPTAFDKLTTLSQPKGLSKGSPLKGEGDQGKGLLWEKKGPGSLIRALSAVIDEMKKDYFSSSSS
jgi:hypothetical protein